MSVCDREASIMRRSLHTGGCCALKKEINLWKIIMAVCFTDFGSDMEIFTNVLTLLVVVCLATL